MIVTALVFGICQLTATSCDWHEGGYDQVRFYVMEKNMETCQKDSIEFVVSQHSPVPNWISMACVEQFEPNNEDKLKTLAELK